MTRRGWVALLLLFAAVLGGPECGGTPKVVLVTGSPTVSLSANQPFVVNVESREARQAQAFAFRITFPSDRLQLVSTELAHGASDLSIAPTAQLTGEVVVHAANTVANYSVQEPQKGVILAELEFLALQTGQAPIAVTSAKLRTTLEGSPVLIAQPVNPVLGAPLTIQVDP